MQTKKSIKELPISERPYEKFISFGADSLSDADLLAIIIKNGTKDMSAIDIAKKLLTGRQGNLLNLYELSYEQLLEIPGIGQVKAIQLKAIAELSMRIAKTKRGYSLTLNSPSSISDYYMEKLRHLREENVICAYFDSKCNFLGDKLISKGTLTFSVVDIGAILKTALEKNASQIVLLHNHPSGDCSPSQNDLTATDNLCEASKIFSITLSDHIIIGDNKYYSFLENNLI